MITAIHFHDERQELGKSYIRLICFKSIIASVIGTTLLRLISYKNFRYIFCHILHMDQLCISLRDEFAYFFISLFVAYFTNEKNFIWNLNWFRIFDLYSFSWKLRDNKNDRVLPTNGLCVWKKFRMLFISLLFIRAIIFFIVFFK